MLRSNSSWMRLRERAVSDAGSASLEFLGLGVLLLVPIAYGAITLVHIEQATLATELAARNSARILSSDPADSRSLADQHTRLALTDLGIDPDDATVTIACAPHPDCAAAEDATLTVTVTTPVPLPGVPYAETWLSIPVSSSATFPCEALTGTQP